MTTTRRSDADGVTVVPEARCADVSEEAGEQLAGTASSWSACLMIELGGPWGPKVLTDARLSAQLRSHLDRPDLRVLLIRRHGRSPTSVATGAGVRVMASWSSAEGTWLEATTVAHPDDLLDLDLDALGRGVRPGWEPVEGPVVLVCTNGQRDVCCAVFGRPVAEALDAVDRDAVWECSHVGGHRYAPNVVVLPSGVSYGRVAPDRAPALLADAYAGRVAAELVRGRVWQSPVEQAAEVAVRRRLGLEGLDAVVAQGAHRADVADGSPESHTVEVRIAASADSPARTLEVTVTRGELTDADGRAVGVLASCGDERTTVPTAWQVDPLPTG